MTCISPVQQLLKGLMGRSCGAGATPILAEKTGTTMWPVRFMIGMAISEEATDCLVFCNLSGGKNPAEVLVKDRYHQIWAYKQQGRLLWRVIDPGGFRTAHQPRPIDIDGDGRDEITAGYALLNPDGSVRWVHEPYGKSPLWVLGEKGELLGQLVTDYSRHHCLLDWNGDGLDEILVAHNGGLYDHKGQFRPCRRGAGKRIGTFGTPGIDAAARQKEYETSMLIGDMTVETLCSLPSYHHTLLHLGLIFANVYCRIMLTISGLDPE